MECHSNIFWQEVKDIMGNNIAICSNDYNGILLFAYLGEYIYQRYYYFKGNIWYKCML